MLNLPELSGTAFLKVRYSDELLEEAEQS